MKKILFGILPFCCMIMVILFISTAKPIQHLREHNLTVQNGLLTVPQHTDRDVFTVQGLWHFTPHQFYYFRNTAQPQYAPLPGKLEETSMESPYGYASYGLRIAGLNPNKIYALRVGHILSSATININGAESSAQGQPGISIGTEEPGKKSSVSIFKPLKNGTADIIINISNFHNRYGGTDKTILLGSAEILHEVFMFDLILYNIACAVLIVFSIFFMLLYFFNFHEMQYMFWFAIASLTIGIRIAVFYPHILTYIWQAIPWKLYFFLRYGSIPLSVLFCTIFIKKVIYTAYNLAYWAIIGLGIVFSIILLILPTQVSAQYLYVQQLFVSIAGLYNIMVILYALIYRKKNALWIFISIAVLIAFAIHDMLVSQWIIQGKLLLQEGAVVAILILVVMSLDSYSSSAVQIGLLVKELNNLQKVLRKFFPNQLLLFLKKNAITEIHSGDYAELPMTILSIDIRSFTAMSEQLDPDEIFALLNRYFACVAPIIRKYGGVILKYLGDGFTALFSGDADYTVSCGIEIQEVLHREKIGTKEFSTIRAGIGIDAGDILFGVLGDDKRLDSIVISNTCYSAEQLQYATKKYSCNLIISDKIVKALKNPDKYRIKPIQDSISSVGTLYEVAGN